MKVKVLYDVFKTMKDKKVLSGEVKVQAFENDKSIFSFSNEFVKDSETGKVKAKISTESNCDENKFKHESTTEFNMKEHDKHHFHGHHGCGEFHGGGMKDKLEHITFFLGVLNKLKVEEEGDKTILSLDLKDVISELKTMRPEINDMMKKHKHPQHEFISELIDMETSEVNLKIWINAAKEVEKAEVIGQGSKKTLDGEVSKASFNVLVKLV